MIAPLLAALSLAVPYLPQTEALCGGAATAMVFRYWGDSHADVQQFAPLVDKRAGGIADGTLVTAIEARGWETLRFSGSIDRLHEEIHRGRPVVILVADRGATNHYLVVTGVDEDAVIVHDPTWGPSRRLAFDDLLAVWKPTRYWSLVILPPADRAAGGKTDLLRERVSIVPEVAPAAASQCDRLLNQAIEDAASRPLGEAYGLLDAVHTQCPGEAAPLSEMAGVRFAEGRWAEAEALARGATERETPSAYAWEVLASSRFMRDDFDGALRAWNHVGKPQVNLIGISGIERTRFQTVATALGLWPNTLLTEGAFRRGERRLRELPGHAEARLTFQPDADGFVTLQAALLPTVGVPSTPAEWSVSAVTAAIDREVRLSVPGTSGQGEVWTGSWRWLNGSPRVAFGFTAPKTGFLGGVWRVDASWESTEYGEAFQESRAHGALSLSDWLTGSLRYSVTGGVDTWDSTSRPGHHRRTLFTGGSLERRWQDDRWSLAGTGTVWISPADGEAFQTTSMQAAFTSARVAEGWVFRADAGIQHASDTAPMGLWPRAGYGRDDSVLLRAHPLFRDGAIDITGGSVLGRTLIYVHGETQRWIASAGPARVGGAAFVDVGRASPAPAGQPSTALVDVGAGVRLRVPGAAGTLRVDIASGLSDDAKALTVGWQF